MLVLTIFSRAQGDPVQQAKEYAQKHKLTHPVLIDSDDRVQRLYHIWVWPSFFIVGRDGKVFHLEVGFGGFMEQVLKRAIEAALKE